MTGYVRQSVADILPGEDITAAPLNAEFGALAAAFSGSTGHTHDGSVGNGPKIPLSTSVVGILPTANGGTGVVSNITATTAPTISNDSVQGYGPGSVWVNVTLDRIYSCLDGSVGAAIWIELPQIKANVLTPHTGAVVDIGSVSARYKDLYLSGTATIPFLSGTTAATDIAMGGFRLTGLGTPSLSGDASTKGYVDTAIGNLIASAPGLLDTLDEIAAALGDDPNFATTITALINTKLALSGGTMTGPIAMGGFSITGLASPSVGTDATNKSYVDGILGSATSAATSASNASTSATNASNSATLAQQWAANPVNVVVSGGLYSALHYASKAADSAALAATFDPSTYYSKTASDARYYTMTTIDANFYSKTASDARYYTMTAADARYVPLAGNVSLTGNIYDTVVDKGTVSTGTVTFDVTTGQRQRLQVGGALTIALSNKPTTAWAIVIELVNGGLATITWPIVSWRKGDGTVSTTFSDMGVALQASGQNLVLLQGTGSGTVYGRAG